nr:hypothetical protein [Stenotrophomonas maltophilia]
MTSTQIEEGATPMMPAADAPASPGVAGRMAVVERCLDGALLTEPLDAAAALSQVIRWNRLLSTDKPYCRVKRAER